MSEPLLLNDRMASFGLSPASVEKKSPAIMRDLRAACTSCGLKALCRQDLASAQRAADVAAYCPNENTLQKLRRT